MSSFSSKDISFDIDVGKEAEKESDKPGMQQCVASGLLLTFS